MSSEPFDGDYRAASALTNEDVASDAKVRSEISAELIDTAQRLDRVVNNLLDMSRLTAGALTLKRDWHDVHDLVSLALAELSGAMSNHKLRLAIPDGFPLVRIDLQLFVQVLTNVLFNAASYAPKGTTIEISAVAAETEVILRVKDEGQGVPVDQLPRIFDKFYRLPGAKTGGTGLGLAVAKSVVETHSGKISASNRPQGGLQVEITLPREPQPELPGESEA